MVLKTRCLLCSVYVELVYALAFAGVFLQIDPFLDNAIIVAAELPR